MKKLAIVFSILLLSLSLWGCEKEYPEAVKEKWGIALPEKANLECVYEVTGTDRETHAEVSYRVYTYEMEDYIYTFFDDWLSSPEHETLRAKNFNEALIQWMETAQVVDDYMCSTNGIYYHYSQTENSEIMFVLEGSLQRLYIVEAKY